MHNQLQLTLDAYRNFRRYDAPAYLAAKSILLNKYFSQSGIKSCIVGVSGGVDSAVTLALLVHASHLPGSPIEHIAPVLLPIHEEGATNQDIATSRGAEVCSALGVSPTEIDLAATLNAARDASLTSGMKGSPVSSPSRA